MNLSGIKLLILESFRFKDQSSARFNFKFLLVFSNKKRHLGKLHCTFFNKKVSRVIYTAGG